MERTKPFGFESLEEALIPVVAHLGGYKKVACALWPNKDPDAAGRKLANCLNSHNPEKLDLEDMLQILRMARAAGCDTGMFYLARCAGYSDPAPGDPIAEQKRVQHELVEGMQDLKDQFSEFMQLSQLIEQAQDIQPPASVVSSIKRAANVSR